MNVYIRQERDGLVPARPSRRTGNRSRSGIALVIVLGFLTLLTILAISFAVNMRTERLSSGLNLQAQMAQQLMHVAQTRALSAIENDLRWEFQTQHGVQRYVDTPMAPTWVVLASTGTVTATLAEGAALDHIPSIAMTHANGATNSINRPAWRNIEVDGQIVGRYAYLIVDCSGLLDITAIGSRARAAFENDSRGIPLTTNLLSELPNAAAAQQFLSDMTNRWKRIESLPELRQALRGAGGNAPELTFFYSYSPNHEWYDNYHQYVRPRIAWGTNLASVQANKETLRRELITDPRSFHNDMRRARTPYWDVQDNADAAWLFLVATDFDPWFSSLEDYLDTDFIPRNLGSYNNEPVPLVSEVIFSNRIVATQVDANNINWINELQIQVEIGFVHPNTGNAANYDLELDLTSFGDLSLSGNPRRTLNASGPRMPNYPHSPTWLPNEYRVNLAETTFNFRHESTVRPGFYRRRPIYTVTLRVRDRDTGQIVDQVSSLTVDSMNCMVDAHGTPLWDGNLRAVVPPFEVQGAMSKTPLGHQLTALANWDHNRFRDRSQSHRPGTRVANWTNVITTGFFNMQSALDLSVTQGVNTWMGYSRSQDRLDHVSEIFRLGYRPPPNDGLTIHSSFSAPSVVAPAGRRLRDTQFWDRYTTTTNLPTRGYINPNSLHSNVIAHAFIGLPAQQFAGIDGMLVSAVNPVYHDGLPTPQQYAFVHRNVVFNSRTARNFARKTILERDVDLERPRIGPQGFAGPKQRTTYQFMGWFDRISYNQAKHYHKFGLWPLPEGLHNDGVFPFRMVADQSVYMGGEWQTGRWFGDNPLRFPVNTGTRHMELDLEDRPGFPQQTLPRPINSVAAENWIFTQTTHSQFAELLNPRQNLFTIILATQSISPKPAGQAVEDIDVIAERRAVSVVWRDPWPTVPSREQETIEFDKGDRTHKIMVRSFHWLDN